MAEGHRGHQWTQAIHSVLCGALACIMPAVVVCWHMLLIGVLEPGPTCPWFTRDFTTLLYTKSESAGASGPGRPHKATSSAVPQHTQPHRPWPMLTLCIQYIGRQVGVGKQH